jgi:hypothetical protein
MRDVEVTTTVDLAPTEAAIVDWTPDGDANVTVRRSARGSEALEETR